MVEKQVTLVASAMVDFEKLMSSYTKMSPSARKKLIERISFKEKEDDRLYTEMVRALKSTFITPIDREDLHKLVATLDMIMDSLEMIAFKTALFKIEKVDKNLKEQAGILLQSFEIIKKLIFSIRNENQVEDYCIKMRKLEQKGDEVYVRALKNLFADSLSPMIVIKFKDLHSSLEKIIDKIHEASLIIESIAVKYS